MVFVKMYLRVSRRSAVATSSAPVPGVCSRFVAVVCSAPVPGVSFAITSSDFQDPVDSHLFHHREGYFVLRHSIGSTASTCSSAISPPVNVNQSSGASRAVKSADYLVSIHTPLFIESVVRVTRSTTSTGYPPISPPVVVNQASGASRAVTSVESLDLVQSPFFFQPDRFQISLGCSTGRCTAASMVIAHKVGRCTGKASLYAWNSFFPEDFSSVSVYLRRFTSVIVNDLVTDFVMDSYILFPGFYELLASTGMVLVNDKIFGENPWLDLKLQLLLLYGSLPRPPESCSVSCSWHRFNTLVCYRMDSADSYRHQNLSRQGERLQDAVDSCCVYLCEADCYGLLIFKSLACEVDVMMLLNLGGLQVLTPLVDGSFRDLYVTADTAMVPHSCYWFCSISLAKKHVDAILGTAAATVGTLMDDFSSVYKPLLGASILRLISEQRFLQVFLHLQSQNYRFFRGISLAISGRFGLLTAIPYVRALRVIRKSLNDPIRRLNNWKRGDPCTSNWTGVLCFNSTLDDGYLHVSELQLFSMNLSGNLSPELGRLTRLTILSFMWNKITGSIPKEIGNIKSLQLLLLNGNLLTGNLPEELGFLPNLDRIQIDENRISGPLPKSFANLNKTKHFHMNNNSISGQIPPELGSLPSIVHILLDNNNLSGYLPPELSNMPHLLILQLDNNHFDGTTIPQSYGNMSKLLKMSLRNCSLQGPVPDLSSIPSLGYLDLSRNQLNGSIPTGKLSDSITTIDLSNNSLTGTIPTNFSGLPRLQKLSLANNALSGSISSRIWQERELNSTESIIVDLRNNRFSNISGRSDVRPNVTVWLQGNPLCSDGNLLRLCGPVTEEDNNQGSTNSSSTTCSDCPPPYEFSPEPLRRCFCAAPLLVGYRLKSPGFSDFVPFRSEFEQYITSGLSLNLYQLRLDSFQWQKGPRLRMYLKFFPVFGSNANNSFIFNRSEVRRIRSMFTGWNIPDEDLFGPYELMNFTLLDVYRDVFPSASPSGLSKGAVVGIVLGAAAVAVTLTAIIALIIMRKRLKGYSAVAKRKRSSKASLKIEGVKSFTYAELALATDNFNSSTQIGQGGYGKVYKGTLGSGMVVAIKRAQEGSLQGEREFLTEIELLSRLHHRNLVSLVGFCDEEGEQMLVYEYMENGTLRDNISVKLQEPLDFAMRLRIALGSAKGILYLHTEADPPIFHRDIKASNILLDSRFTAKVADFGLSRLAPVPDMEGISPHHVSTVVKGTPGYLDPEYFLTHQLTDKSDVYSLGVVFLELLTGMQPITHGKNIVREINIAYESGSILSAVDKRMSSVPAECLEKFATLALRCCREETEARPSMAEVVRELEIIWELMPESQVAKAVDLSETMTHPSSSSNTSIMKHPYSSMDVSGSDLVSGVAPSVSPR